MQHFHYNNILLRNETLILVNLQRVQKLDADFLAEYYEIIKMFEKAQKQVLVVGLKKKFFEEHQIYDQGWILEYKKSGRILFLDQFDQSPPEEGDVKDYSGKASRILGLLLNFLKRK